MNNEIKRLSYKCDSLFLRGALSEPKESLVDLVACIRNALSGTVLHANVIFCNKKDVLR